MIARELASGAQRVAARLTGVPIPAVLLASFQEHLLDLRQLAQQRPLVIYLYPGSNRSPADGEQTPLMDHAQHRAFFDHRAARATRNYQAVGISSQSVKA